MWAMHPPRRLVEFDSRESGHKKTLSLYLPLGYWVIFFYYLTINSLLGFLPNIFPSVPLTFQSNDFTSFLMNRFLVNFSLFVGLPVMLLAIFQIYLFPLTYHRHNFLTAFLGWLVSLAVLYALGLGWFAMLKQFGFSLSSVPVVVASREFFSGINLYLLGLPVAFVVWGFPSEFFRSVLLGGGIRTNNSFVFSLLLVFSSVAYGTMYLSFGAGIAVSEGLFGLLLGLYYFLRRSFWELVFLHTFSLFAISAMPLGKLPML